MTVSAIPSSQADIGVNPVPTVSVCVITYNHEKYIRQALASVLMQVADFDIEVIVADDASKDRTQAIVREVASASPHKFSLMLREVNVGPARNFEELLLAARGEFIAYLEGDDYWTSRFKLARQIELLRQHPECSGSFHDVEMEVVGEERDGRKRYTGHLVSNFVGVEDMLHRNIVPSSSVVFRREGCIPLPGWVFQLRIGDWTLHLLNVARGPYVYVDDLLGVYRSHPGGNWNARPLSYQLQAILETYDLVDSHFAGRHGAAVREQVRRYKWQLVHALLDERRATEAARILPGLLSTSFAAEPLSSVRRSLGLARAAARSLVKLVADASRLNSTEGASGDSR